MKRDKYILTEINRKDLRALRKKYNLAAEDVSVELGYSKAWLGQIERGKLQTIKQDDLAKLLSLYCPIWNPEEIINKEVLTNFLACGMLIESMDNYLSELHEISFPDIFYKCIEPLATQNLKEDSFKAISAFIYCINEFPSTMNTFLSKSFILQMILENYSILPADLYLSNIHSFFQKLSNLLDEECKNSDILALKYLKDED